MSWFTELRNHPAPTLPASVVRPLEIVVPYCEPALTGAVLKKAAQMAAGLDAHVSLIAVHTLPYPLPFVCPTLVHAYLVEQLMELASHAGLPVNPQVVLARDRTEAFRFAIPKGSTVLVGTRKRLWRTAEEKLARRLALDGHHVAVVPITGDTCSI